MQRVSTEFADIACTEANARQLVEALHRGTEVTLTGENGKSVTFTPTTSLGYGETYLAMALAAETLRQNGVTDCATPEQWRAVFLGGPLTVSSTVATATARSDFPGILVLRSQGQGWGRIAQTSNVQINQVVSNARSSFSLETNESSGLSAPTGEMDTEPKSSGTTKGTSGRKQSTDPKTGASAYGSSTQKAHEKADNSSSRSSHHRDTDADTGNRTKEDKKIKKDRDDPRN